MLILRDVHFVRRHRECLVAMVEGHDVDVAHLAVYVEWLQSRPGGPPDPAQWIEVCCVRYDERGDIGTWHTERDCPWKNKASV